MRKRLFAALNCIQMQLIIVPKKSDPMKKHKSLPKQTCLYCQEKFTPVRSWQRHCSVKCRNATYWSTHKIVKI